MNSNPILAQLREEGRTVLTEVESKQFLRATGLPVVSTGEAATKETAVLLAAEIGFPVAMKILSPDITHKSDAGGVRLNLDGAAEVEAAFDEIMANARKHYPVAPIQGVSVQKMAAPGVEVIIGMSKDPQFGPLLMFGLGGIMVELLKDVAFRIVPLSPRDAREMIGEVKGYSLLAGFRGAEPVDILFLERLLLQVSDLVESHPEIKELDLNPVIAYKDGALVVDSRVILDAGS
jgi:acetate---CoA ligase (ADP-forming) subunit beta